MKKPILIGKGFRKISLEKLLTNTTIPNNSVVLFDAIPNFVHTSSNNLINIENFSITLKGDGGPEDTILGTTINLVNSNVVIKNMTIDSTNFDAHTILISGSSVTLENVIFKSSKDHCGIFITDNSNVSINNVTVSVGDNKTFGLYLSGNSRMSVENSLIQSIGIVENSYAEIQNNLLTGSLTVDNDSVIKSNELYIEHETDLIDVFISNQSQAYLEDTTILDGTSQAEVTEGYLSIDKIKTNNLNGFVVYRDDYSDVIGEGFETINRDEQLQLNLSNETHQFTNDNNDKQSNTNPNYESNNSLNYNEDTDDETKKIEDYNFQLDALEELNSLTGLNNVKEATKKFINIAKINKVKQERGLSVQTPNMHSMFIGNPGTGKTTVARLIARALYEEGVIAEDNFVEVGRQDLVSEYVGRTASQTMEVLDKAKNGVLFIDEAYTLTSSDQDKGIGQESIDTILKYMEDHRDEIVIIFAGYTNEMMTFKNSNPGLSSRIPYIFDFEDYSLDQLVEIGNNDLISQGYKFNLNHYKQVLTKEYNRNFDNSNGRWVRNFNEQLTAHQMQRVSENNDFSDENLVTIKDEDLNIFDTSVDETVGSLQQLLEELDSLIGLKNVKERVQAIVNEVKFNQLLENQGHSISKGNYHMVFTGSPGTGKTTVARLLANIFKSLGILSKGHLVETERSELVGSYIGHTEKNTKKKIEQSSGGILFVDEAYQLTPRDNSTNDFGIQAVETLITELENRRGEFITIFAGYENEISRFLEYNEGLKSRIPYIIHFEDYTASEVADIVVSSLRKENWKFNEQLLRTVVEKNYSKLEESNKSNGRWARNFVQELLVQHKNNVINQDIDSLDLVSIEDSTIDSLKNY